MLALVFWASVALIGYHLFAYPVLARMLASWRRSPPQAAAGQNLEEVSLPRVTVIVPAHNEEKVIDAKVRNLADLNYPPEKLDCVIALDGCTDATQSIAKDALSAVGGKHISLAFYQRNIGKIALLNDQIAKVQSEIVALTDASAIVSPDALHRGVEHFRDPMVGVVTGAYSVAGSGSHGESAYWRYQSELRITENALGGPMGAHGAFYLFRRSAWTPLPPDTINDDFVLPMTIVLGGLRTVLEPAIRTHELERTIEGQEFRRRVRIGAGNIQQVLRLWRLADPRLGWTVFTFLSGKGLRGILPFLLMATMASSALLTLGGNLLFALPFSAGVLSLAIAVWGRRLPWLCKSRSGNMLLYVLEGYLAMTIGAMLVIFGMEGDVWRFSNRFRH